MMDDIGSKRPDCGFCGAKESAITVLIGQAACGKCLMKYDDHQSKKREEELKEFKDFLKD